MHKKETFRKLSSLVAKIKCSLQQVFQRDRKPISYIIALLLNNTRSNRHWNAVKIMCEYRKSPRRSWLKRKNTFWHSYCVMRFPVSKQTVNYIIMWPESCITCNPTGSITAKKYWPVFGHSKFHLQKIAVLSWMSKPSAMSESNKIAKINRNICLILNATYCGGHCETILVKVQITL